MTVVKTEQDQTNFYLGTDLNEIMPGASLIPASALNLFRGRFEEIIRYLNNKGELHEFMNGHEETDWRHIQICVHIARVLGKKKDLQVFNFEKIENLLWLHELDELFIGDHSKSNEGRKFDKILLDETKQGIKDYLADNLNMSDAAREVWISQIELMDQPSAHSNPDLLLAKLIDWFAGDLTVAFFSNDQVNPEKQISIFNRDSGPLFLRLLDVVYPQDSQAAQIIVEQMLLPLRAVFFDRGIDLPVASYIPEALKEELGSDLKKALGVE